MNTTKQPYGSTPEHRLTEREREILRLVVKNFIETAGPVGSRYLAKHSGIGLSPASIRNTMSDLEEYGYLEHPYTSAGRVPTDLGYRAFVDSLMESPALSQAEKQVLLAELERLVGNTDDVLRESSRLLGRFSNMLGVALSPKLSTGILERMEVVHLSSSRLMFVVSVRGGLVKTIVLEMQSELRRDEVEQVVALLNERLAGLTLEEVRCTYESRVRDLSDRSGIVRLVLKEGAVLFSDPAEARRLQVAGTHHLLQQPEFQEPADLRGLITMLEDEDFVVHLLEDRQIDTAVGPCRAVISIGREHSEEKAERYSIVSARYQIGQTVGTLGIIGPMRMDYARMIALVENMAVFLTRTDGAS